MLTRFFALLVTLSPALKRTLWKKWYQILAGGYRQADWTFMNYGFDTIDPQAPPLPLEAADEPDRYSIQLYQHVAGAVDLEGRNVLEVGSGRGGGSSYIARYLRPASLLGIDFSEKAVALCNKRHHVPGLSFRQGDAEALPCEADTFDVVINVESSHCYGSMETFLQEVRRVLKPGGYFSWVDFWSREGTEEMRQLFQKAGLEMVRETDITPNVLRGLDAISEAKERKIRKQVPGFLRRAFADFAGVKGTRVYESLRRGEVAYMSCVLRKPG